MHLMINIDQLYLQQNTLLTKQLNYFYIYDKITN